MPGCFPHHSLVTEFFKRCQTMPHASLFVSGIVCIGERGRVHQDFNFLPFSLEKKSHVTMTKSLAKEDYKLKQQESPLQHLKSCDLGGGEPAPSQVGITKEAASAPAEAVMVDAGHLQSKVWL